MFSGWFDPSTLVPPHRVTRPDQVIDLANLFNESGWDHSCPTLRGYMDGQMIQLLSGTHRRSAAIMAKIKVPVVVWDKAYIESAWGTYEWDRVMGIGRYAAEGNKLYD